MNCIFSEPVELTEGDFEYSKLVCDPGETIELVENLDTGAEFYLSKVFTYGDMIMIWFATIFLIFLITKTLFGFFWKR